MANLKERERAFEAEYSLNQELAFRITARRHRLWAAAKMGLVACEAVETYAKAVIAADFEAPGDEDVIGKIRADLAGKLAGKDVVIAEAELRTELARAAAEARRQALAPSAASSVPPR